MTCYVFRRLAGGGGRVSYFDTQELTPLGPEVALATDPGAELDWGRSNPGSSRLAGLICEREGVPEALLREVAWEFRENFLRQLDPGNHCIPGWLIGQEVVRLCVRVMGYVTIKDEEGSDHV